MNRTIFVSRRQTHSLIHCEFMQKIGRRNRQQNSKQQQQWDTSSNVFCGKNEVWKYFKDDIDDDLGLGTWLHTLYAYFLL